MLQSGDSAGAEALLQSALKHWQGEASARPRDPAAAAGVSWCLQRLVALKVSEVCVLLPHRGLCFVVFYFKE